VPAPTRTPRLEVVALAEVPGVTPAAGPPAARVPVSLLSPAVLAFGRMRSGLKSSLPPALAGSDVARGDRPRAVEAFVNGFSVREPGALDTYFRS